MDTLDKTTQSCDDENDLLANQNAVNRCLLNANDEETAVIETGKLLMCATCHDRNLRQFIVNTGRQQCSVAQLSVVVGDSGS